MIRLFKNSEEQKNVIINLKWIDDFHVLVLTADEFVHLIELHKGTVLATQRISNINLVYHTADYKVTVCVLV